MVGKIKITFSAEFIDYLDQLIKILYKKEYFGFIESSDFYVSKIYDFIEENIQLSQQEKHLRNFKILVPIIFSTNPINELLGTFFSKIKKIII